MRGERRKVSPINLPAKATGPGEVFSLQNHTEQKGGYFQRNAIGMGVFVEPVIEGYGLIPPYMMNPRMIGRLFPTPLSTKQVPRQSRIFRRQRSCSRYATRSKARKRPDPRVCAAYAQGHRERSQQTIQVAYAPGGAPPSGNSFGAPEAPGLSKRQISQAAQIRGTCCVSL